MAHLIILITVFENLLCNRCYTKHQINIIFIFEQENKERMPMAQVRKLRLREVKKGFTSNEDVNKWQRRVTLTVKIFSLHPLNRVT